MKELEAALERANMGWDRDKAREVLAESISTIQKAGKLARIAIDEQETNKVSLGEVITELRDLIEAIGPISGSRSEGNMTRSQASKIISLLTRAIRSQDVSTLVKMSLDLTNQSRIFVDMMEKVDRRYGEEDRQREQDITEWLNSAQLLQVYEWVEENRG